MGLGGRGEVEEAEEEEEGGRRKGDLMTLFVEATVIAA